MNITRRKLSQNTLTLLFSNSGSALLSFALSALIGRALGQEGLGIYAAALAWIFPLSLMADFGLNTLITRDLAQYPEAEYSYLRVAIYQRLVMGGVLMLSAILAAPLLSENLSVIRGIIISAPLILITPLFSMFTAVFRARQCMWPIAALNLGMLVVQVSATAAIFAWGYGVITALAVNTLTSAGQLATAWGLWRWLSSDGQHIAIHIGIRETISKAGVFAIAAVLAALLMRMNYILLERLAGANETGNYAAAMRFIDAIRMIPNALFGALLPALATLQTQPSMMQQTFRRVLAGLSVYSIAIAIVGMWISPIVLLWVYGEAFIDAATILQWGLWALLPALLRGGFTLYHYARGNEHIVNVVLLVGLGMQLSIGFWLIPTQGGKGAIIATLCAEIMMLILLRWPIWQHLRMRPQASS